MKFESYKEMTESVEKRQEYALHRINDLLDQIERLKAIDASQDPRLQIETSFAIKDVYETLEKLPFC